MKKLLLIIGIMAGAPLFSMEIGRVSMDTSDDRPVPRGIPAPVRMAMSQEFGMEVDSINPMAQIRAAMNTKERAELNWKALAYESSTSDSSDSDDDIMDEDISDADLDDVMALGSGDISTSKKDSLPKNKKKSVSAAKSKRGLGELLATCTQCSAQLYERKQTHVSRLSGQSIFHRRMNGRCPGYPDCIEFTDYAKKKYAQCDQKKNGSRCSYLFSRKDKTGQHINHCRTHHPETLADSTEKEA